MERNYNLPGALTAVGVLLLAILITGCQSKSNPWVGESYEDPVGYRSPPQAIYAPNMIVPPSIEGTAMETDESLEAELDLLRELD